MIPPSRILAATDFSEGSRVALTFAARMAKQCRATLHVLHAEDPLLSAAAQQAGIDLSRDTREALQAFIVSAGPAADYAPQHHVVCGPAADVIVDVARREHADLIVVGSRGMSGAERLIFGSTTEGVLRRANTPVLVVPPGWIPVHPGTSDLAGIGPIIVAVDFSPESRAALSAACDLATALATDVEAVHIVPRLPVLERWQAHADAAVRQRVQSARVDLAVLAGELASSPAVRLRVETGDVPEELATLAARTADRRPLLVLGRRPGRLGAAPGAIAYRVLTLAAVPVLMHVPPE